MKKSEFRTPLIQSAAVLGGVLLLFAIIASSGASTSGGGILAIIFGIGNLILFFIGMGIALCISIAVLIAIFLAAVAMFDTGQAAEMFSDLKKNSSCIALAVNRQCWENSNAATALSKEEYDRMKHEISLLQERNLALQGNINDITDNNTLLQESIYDLRGENSTLKEKIEDLSTAIEDLQSSEKEIKELVDTLNEKIQAGADQELKDQIIKIEQLHSETRLEIENLMNRLNNLESGIKQSPLSGIFTYIENEKDQNLFIQKVEEALAQELTYAQIDDFLTQTLPEGLDKIIKDHPSLTRNYIRNLRRE